MLDFNKTNILIKDRYSDIDLIGGYLPHKVYFLFEKEGLIVLL